MAAFAALDQVDHSSLRGGGQHVELLGVLISVLVESGEVDAPPETYVREMLRLARATANNSAVLGRAHWVAMNTYVQMGHHDLARHHLTEARQALAAPTLSFHDWLRFCRSAAVVLPQVPRRRSS